MIALFFFSACTPSHKAEVDRLNELSYAFHYRNLDSTKVLARRALRLSDDYTSGYAEACNNLAFVSIAKLNFRDAKLWLQKVEEKSNNQIELLIADVQNMRICQREAHNRDFYYYQEKASSRLHRICEEANNLPPRERQRVKYAKSEFYIVDATYFYYVGLDAPMQKALKNIDPDELESDTAQYLNYLYNIGSGGAITDGSPEQIAQTEFDYLMQCYMLASSGDAYPYWQANSLQAISEHLQRPGQRDFLIKNNLPAIKYLNDEQMPDSLLAGNLAQRALNLFLSYGDTYQIAGGYRTLSECYFSIEDYLSAGDCLLRALNNDSAINQAPDLVASIRERLSMVYSAIDDKQRSDYNRNIYLDLQEQTRQDRQLEARAALLDRSSMQLNLMIAAVIAMIMVVIVLLYFFDRMRRHKDKTHSVSLLLKPLEKWKQVHEQGLKIKAEEREELEENLQVANLHVSENKKRNLEQRAKVSLVNSIMPFIDRMIYEVDCLCTGKDKLEVRRERYQYISELTDKINQYNNVLTQWIQMRQGSLNLRIESFPLQPLFDIVQKGKMGFKMKGVELHVKPTELVVKADRTLTLFMINTIADNARKFTPQGGSVTIEAHEQKDCVEVSVKDDGKGMDQEQLSHIFDRTYTGGHGFGLLNCKGIIEKYKKISSIFSVCDIYAESEVGRGSKFVFRLPKGVGRKGSSFGMVKSVLVMLLAVLPLGRIISGTTDTLHWQGQMDVHVSQQKLHHKHSKLQVKSADLKLADAFADSAYFSNINGTYRKTLVYADSAISYLNRHYLSVCPNGKLLMIKKPRIVEAAELKWYQDSVATNYNIILDIRNESAVAALALHDWDLYNSNNKVYTQLFRDLSSDGTLPAYVRTMQTSENSKTVAVILLVLLLLQLPVAYYFLYYRHVLNFRYAVEKIRSINQVLLDESCSDEDKLSRIERMWDSHRDIAVSNQQLNEVVDEIKAALHKSICYSEDEAKKYGLMLDELHRTEYENGKLHVSNAVLDNCLSTLKHETMYYPSRIRQLIDSDPSDVLSLRELVDYYKELYTMLSAQAMEQVELNVKFDKKMILYLFKILADNRPVEKAEMPFSQSEVGRRYVVYRIEFVGETYNESVHSLLFTPLTHDLKYLLCRQIVREIGEVTNLRGCGILTKPSKAGFLLIEVILPKKIEQIVDKNIKLK